MTQNVWLIPLMPLLAFVLIIWRGDRLPGRGAFVSIAGIVLAGLGGLQLLGEVGMGARADLTYRWVTLGNHPLTVGFVVDPHLLGRLHARGSTVFAVLRLSVALPVLDALPGPRRQLSLHLRRVGARGVVLLLADRFLVRAPLRRAGGAQSVYHDPGRRFFDDDRDPDPIPAHAHPELYRGVQGHRGRPDRRPLADRRRDLGIRRRGGQVRAGASPRVAAGRDGGADPGERVDPRGDDGGGRRVPGGPHLPAVHPFPRAQRALGGGVDRRDHRPVCGHDGRRRGRYQARARLLHGQPAGLHDDGPRGAGVFGGDVSLDHPRLL